MVVMVDRPTIHCLIPSPSAVVWVWTAEELNISPQVEMICFKIESSPEKWNTWNSNITVTCKCNTYDKLLIWSWFREPYWTFSALWIIPSQNGAFSEKIWKSCFCLFGSVLERIIWDLLGSNSDIKRETASSFEKEIDLKQSNFFFFAPLQFFRLLPFLSLAVEENCKVSIQYQINWSLHCVSQWIELHLGFDHLQASSYFSNSFENWTIP